MTRTTIVTHPDGTVSKRTSKSRVYAYAVQVATTREARIQRALDEAASRAEAAEKYEAALADGTITEERTSWGGWGKDPRTEFRVVLNVGGIFASSYITPREERPTDDDLRAAVQRYADTARNHEARYEAKADRLSEGPPVDYGIVRWSSRKDLAVKAADGEFAYLQRQDGVTVTVVECTELVKGAAS